MVRHYRFSKANILHLYWNSKHEYPRLNDIHGYGSAGAEYDRAIQFWLNYWAAAGFLPKGIDPLLIKALISYESSFDPKARQQRPGYTAAGLTQITNPSLRGLRGEPNDHGYREIKNGILIITRDELFNPVVNIAAGTRWLAYKYATIPKKARKTVWNAIKNYHSWDAGGDAYAKEVFARYRASKTPAP